VKELKHFPLEDVKCTRKDPEMEITRSPLAILQEVHDPVPKNVLSAAELAIGLTSVPAEFSVHCAVVVATMKEVARCNARFAPKFILEGSVIWRRHGRISRLGMLVAAKKTAPSRGCRLAFFAS
jgi:hypothetical protein